MVRRSRGFWLLLCVGTTILLQIHVDRSLLSQLGFSVGFTDQQLLSSTSRSASVNETGRLRAVGYNNYSSIIDESLLDLSRSVVHPKSNVRAAVCLKTIFGEGRPGLMKHVLAWVVYNRLLGFDDILVWYMKNFTPPGFELLETLPYVRLYENRRNPLVTPDDYEINPTNAGGQKGDIAECFKVTQHKYDWVFIADWDEYLWFSEKMRLKEFLHRHRRKHYLSFGKWMYDHKLRVQTEDDIFGVERVSPHVRCVG